MGFPERFPEGKGKEFRFSPERRRFAGVISREEKKKRSDRLRMEVTTNGRVYPKTVSPPVTQGIKAEPAPMRLCYKGMNCLPEDDEDFGFTVNPCTFEMPTDTPRDFSYRLYQDFNRFKSFLLFKAQERVNTVLNKKTSMEIPPDDFFEKKYVAMYGPVDLNHPLIRKRLKVLKATMIEASATNPEDPVIFGQYLDEEIDPEDPFVCLARLQENIVARYKYCIQVKYGNPNPVDSGGDWFVHSRPDVSELRRIYYPDRKTQTEKHSNTGTWNSTKMPSTRASSNSSVDFDRKIDHLAEDLKKNPVDLLQLKRKQTSKKKAMKLENLHVYDPKFEFCFRPPYIIFYNQTKIQQDGEIPRMLSFRILDILNQFPFGIAVSIFWEKFYKMYNYFPNTSATPSLMNLLQLHEDEICFVKMKDNRVIMIPRHLAGVIDPDVLLQRVWHAIRCILEQCAAIETSEVMQEIENQYGFSFDPLLWDYQSVTEFLCYLVKKFTFDSEIIVKEIEYAVGNVPTKRTFLMLRNAELEKDLENILEDKVEMKQKEPTVPCIPDGFLKENHTIQYVSDNLNHYDILHAKLKTVHDPENLILFLEDDEENVMQFHTGLQSGTSLEMFNKDKFIPDPKCLAIGMYVMAYIKWDELKPLWYRVRIISMEEEDTMYLVYGIDFGLLEYVNVNDLRYMPHVIGEEIAHAIPVKLHGVTHPKGEVYWHSDLAAHAVDRVFKYKDYILRITLVKGHYSHAMGCSKWSVTCDIVNQNNKDADGNVIYTTFRTRFGKHFKRVYNDLIKKEKRLEESENGKTTEKTEENKIS